MLADGHYVDGSWLLTIYIDELDIERQLRVQGDWFVGEVVSQLIHELPPPKSEPCRPHEISLRSGVARTGWGDHCLWWPAKSKWLLHNRISLNQCGLQADALLRFVPIHGRLRIQLPDLQIRHFAEVNFSDPVFRITMSICRQLNIRHPEELSLAYPLAPTDLKPARILAGVTDRRHHGMDAIGKHGTFQRSATISTTHSHTKNAAAARFSTLMADHQDNDKAEPKMNGVARRSSNSSQHLFGPPRVRDKRSSVRVSTAWHPISSKYSPSLNNSNFYPGSINTLAFEFRTLEDPSLACSPLVGLDEACAKCYILHPSNFMHRLRLNVKWLDSSKSLMEQDVDVLTRCNTNLSPNEAGNCTVTRMAAADSSSDGSSEAPILLLRFKYGSYYDLNQKYDAVRINQLYEQAKWSVISEHLETTDDEACLLAALQAHVEIAAQREEKEASALALSQQAGTDQQDSSNDVKSTMPQSHHPRDISPLGSYLRHQPDSKSPPNRPLSVVELDSQIDALLDELATGDGADLTSFGGHHRSRPRRRRTPRPMSVVANSSTQAPADPGPPQLTSYIKVCKPRKFGLRLFRRVFVVTDKLRLLVYKNEDEYKAKNEASEVVYLPGCEVQPDLCVTSDRFSVRIFVPVSRTNLPLSAAFNLGAIDDHRGPEEELGFGSRFRRRASLLSLTSLSHFGLQSPSGLSGGLCGASANVLGLMNETVFRFSDTETYADWLAFLRLATAVPNISGLPAQGEDRPDLDPSPPTAEWASILNRATYEAERKAITGLIRLISPGSAAADQVDSNIQVSALHTRLEQRFGDFLPMRMTMNKHLFRTLDARSRDQSDSPLAKTTTLPSDGKHLISPINLGLSHAQKATICRRISIAYSKIHELTSSQAKLKYISAWEQIPNHGIVFFPARIEVTVPYASLVGNDADRGANSKQHGSNAPWVNQPLGGGNVTISSSRRVEAVGIGPTRVFRCDIQTGEILASWRLSAVHGWHINWELGELVLLLAQTPPSVMTQTTNEAQRSPSPVPMVKESAGRVIIRPLGVPVRTVAEFLGGYTFLNLRSPEKNQGLDESVFYKLTTGSPFPMSHSNGPHH